MPNTITTKDKPNPDILIIEDDPLTHKALPALLAVNGFTSKLVSNFSEGLEEVKNDYKFVLVDLVLPDGDGLDILKSMRDQGIKSKCAITTGYLDNDIELFGYKVLIKPIDLDELLQFLNS